jgi:hypothetical protein
MNELLRDDAPAVDFTDQLSDGTLDRAEDAIPICWTS